MSLTIHLPAATERKLAERAARSGQTVEGFVAGLVEREVTGGDGTQPDIQGAVREMLDYRDREKRTLGGSTVRELREEGRR